jgi:hypothetical protein
MACPDGCGSVLTVNLDPRAGKAWRLYVRDRLSVYPSVWRDGGCGAHFIVWKDRILWCDGEDDEQPPKYEPNLERSISATLSDTPRSAGEIADDLDEIPWEVDRSLKHLVRMGLAEAIGKEPVRFRLIQSRSEQNETTSSKLPRRRWWHRFWQRD